MESNIDIMAVLAAVFTVLFAVSELLALNPKIKANSVFQAIQNFIKSVQEKFLVKKP